MSDDRRRDGQRVTAEYSLCTGATIDDIRVGGGLPCRQRARATYSAIKLTNDRRNCYYYLVRS